MKVGELFVDLFIKTDDRNLKDFIHDLGELKMASLVNSIGLAGVYEGIKKVLEVADRTALSINNFAAQTGQSAQEFQKWSKFAQQFGLDANVVGSSIATLEDNIMQLKLTGQGANAWQILGIDPRGFKDIFQLLSAIREKMKGVPIETQRFMLSQIGLSKELVQLLNVTDKEWMSISDNMAVSNDNLSIMKEYHQKINKLSQDWISLVTDLGAELAPIANLLFIILDTMVKIADQFRHVIGPAMLLAGIGLKNPGLIAGGSALTLGDIIGTLKPQSGSKSQNNNINFNITGNDPHAIAQAVDERIRRHLSDAEYQTALPNN